MKINKDNTCIIFGCSPFINEFGQDKIKYLINNYITFGVNNFPRTYNDVDYWIWSDYGAYEDSKQYIKNQKIITSLEVYRREICGDFEPEYVFEGVSEIQHELNNNLAIYKTTAHPAINYAYLLGFKNIILCGVDLTSNWNHFYPSQRFIRTEKRIKRIRSKLYEFKKYINLHIF